MCQEDENNEDEVRGGCISNQQIDDVCLGIVPKASVFSSFTVSLDSFVMMP